MSWTVEARQLRIALAVGLSAVIVVSGRSIAAAQTIQLHDDTNLSGDVLQTDDDSVVIRLPRAQIKTIDGQPLPPALTVGVASPAFSVKDLSGATQTVGPGSGHLTVLHFWVQWCPHCRSDAPQIQALHDQFHDNPHVKVVTVNLDQERAKVEAFISEHHVTYPVILATEQAQPPISVDLPKLYQINGFPVTMLIDEQGVIRSKTVGSFVESKVDMSAKVAELLPKPEPPKSQAPSDKQTRKKHWFGS